MISALKSLDSSLDEIVRQLQHNKNLAGIDKLPLKIKKLVWEFDVHIPKSCWDMPEAALRQGCIKAVEQRTLQHWGKDHPGSGVHDITLEDLGL